VAISDPVEAFADSEPATEPETIPFLSIKDGREMAEAWKKLRESPISLKMELDDDSARIVNKYLHGEPLVYTQAMKDAGELPSVGMVAVAVSPMSNWGVVEIVYINKMQFVCIDDKGDVLIHYVNEDETFKPIDTRTPEQKQVDSAVQDIHSSMFDLSNETASDLVMMLQARGHLAEIKS
jgi:hypothetical protein